MERENAVDADPAPAQAAGKKATAVRCSPNSLVGPAGVGGDPSPVLPGESPTQPTKLSGRGGIRNAFPPRKKGPQVEASYPYNIK